MEDVINKISSEKRQAHLLLLIFCLVKFAFHLLTNHFYGFHRDEFLYMDYGRHLSFGYYEVPPFTAFLAWFSHNFFGDSVFALRMLPAISGSLTLFVSGLITLELGGGRFAVFLTSLSLFFSALLRTDMLFQPVTFDIFFWTSCSYLLLRFLKSSDSRNLVSLGIVFGLAVLNKYTIFLWAGGAVLGLLLTGRQKVLTEKNTLTGFLLSFLIILPNLIWQVLHGIPALGHLNTLRSGQFVHVSYVDFVLQQFVFFGPGSLIWICGLIYLFSGKGKVLRAMVFIFVLTFVVLLVFKGKSYYALGLYPALIGIGSFCIETIGKRWVLWMLRPALSLLILLYAVFMLPAAVPVLPLTTERSYCKWLEIHTGIETRKWEDGQIHHLPQDFADMNGWIECGQKASYWYNSIPVAQRGDYILCASNYGLAAAIDFYGQDQKLPEVYNGSSGMLAWVPLTIKAHKILYVGSDAGKDLSLFDKVQIVDSITDPESRERGTYVILASGFKGDMPSFWKKIYTVKEKEGPFFE